MSSYLSSYHEKFLLLPHLQNKGTELKFQGTELKFQGTELKFPPSPTRWGRIPNFAEVYTFHAQHFGTNTDASRVRAYARSTEVYTFYLHLSSLPFVNMLISLIHKPLPKLYEGDSKFSLGIIFRQHHIKIGHGHEIIKSSSEYLMWLNLCKHSFLPSPLKSVFFIPLFAHLHICTFAHLLRIICEAL